MNFRSNLFAQASFEKKSYVNKKLFNESLYCEILNKNNGHNQEINQNSKIIQDFKHMSNFRGSPSAPVMEEDNAELLQDLKWMSQLDMAPSAPIMEMEEDRADLLQELKWMGNLEMPPRAPIMNMEDDSAELLSNPVMVPSAPILEVEDDSDMDPSAPVDENEIEIQYQQENRIDFENYPLPLIASYEELKNDTSSMNDLDFEKSTILDPDDVFSPMDRPARKFDENNTYGGYNSMIYY